MGREEPLKTQLKKFKKKLEKKLGTVQMILFGSTAEGTAGPESDVDLIIVSSKFAGKKLHNRPKGFWLAWDIDKPVDFLCFTPEEFEQRKKGVTIVSHALKTGIVI